MRPFIQLSLTMAKEGKQQKIRQNYNPFYLSLIFWCLFADIELLLVF